MPKLLIRNLPAHIYDKIAALAAKSDRSMQEQVRILLEQALDSSSSTIRRAEALDRLSWRINASWMDPVSLVRSDRDR
jgi:plasmid stability protein